MADSETKPNDDVRRPYKGSCHCKATQYILWATFPPPQNQPTSRPKVPPPNTVRVYKCNCTICHKAGIFHIRLPSAPDDFALLSPLDPFTELGAYETEKDGMKFFFCKKCGVRCFSFYGEGELVTRGDIPGREGQEVQIWRPKKDGWTEFGVSGDLAPVDSYLSVNAHSLDARQEGLDLRVWAEEKRIAYVDALDWKESDTMKRPHVGGTY
jgi:hypothetical protein